MLLRRAARQIPDPLPIPPHPRGLDDVIHCDPGLEVDEDPDRGSGRRRHAASGVRRDGDMLGQ